MISKESYHELKKHEQIFDLVYNHGYVPQASNDSFLAIAKLHSKIFNIPLVDMTCEGCRSDMLRQMYNSLKEYEKHNPELNPQEDAVSALEGTIVEPTDQERKEMNEVNNILNGKKKRKRKA